MVHSSPGLLVSAGHWDASYSYLICIEALKSELEVLSYKLEVYVFPDLALSREGKSFRII
jgi:hypothetical protein